ncbi:unnamed protein product [Peniophora sp. CBMAI 1063]|nr:unnamed protein product [Peniophora sp. CBMAI 1063]
MRSSLLAALAGALAVSALKVPVRKLSRPYPTRKRALSSRAAAADTLDLSTYNDMLYIANVTLGGQEYLVQLDTGSSDLWVKGGSFPISNSTTTTLAHNLTYGAGWAYGNVSYAAATFADITIPAQAFLDVVSAENAVLDYGTSGVMGLGFNSLSTIDAVVNASDSSKGRSLLYNLFYDNPETANFIAFSLQRSADTDADSVEGTFSIGELEEKYASINTTSGIPTFPETAPKRWNVLLDAVLVGDNTVAVSSSVDGAPSNKAVVLLDTGSSFTYAPSAVVNAIYGGISGASYSASDGLWKVPCSAEVDMALQFNGVVFPLHPLDVVIKSGTGVDVCVGTFIPQDTSSIGSGVVDWIAGDNFLRAVYSVYDFGDFDAQGEMGNPYVQLLSLVDPDEASADFAKERGTTARSGITYNAAKTSSSGTTVSVSSDLESTLDKINTYLPVVLAIMAFNALVLLIILIGGVVWFIRRRKSQREPGSRQRKNKGRMTPMPLESFAGPSGSRNDPISYAETSYMRDSYMDPSMQSPLKPHMYQPVSMALTEDTFVPPSPAFGKGDRPKSMA